MNTQNKTRIIREARSEMAFAKALLATDPSNRWLALWHLDIARQLFGIIIPRDDMPF